MKIITRLCILLLVFVSHASLAQDCDGPSVKFGEVMSGLQAGFTGGSANENTLPSGFFLGTSGMDQRGFIDPESGSGWKCDGDWGVISAWIGCPIENSAGVTVRTRKEAKECADAGNILIGFEFGIWTRIEIRVDGVTLESVKTKAKLGPLPLQFGDRLAGIQSTGAFLEPYSLAPGTHTATALFHVSQEACDFFGVSCPFSTDLSADFEVLPD